MKNPKNIWLASVLAITLTIGFISGRITSKDTQASISRSEAQKKSLYSASRSTTRNGKYILFNKRKSQSSRSALKALINRLDRNTTTGTDSEVWEAVRNLSESEIQEAILSLEDIESTQLRTQIQRMLMSRWGQINGIAAIKYAQTIPNKHAKILGAIGVINSWIKENPEAVFSWYKANRDQLSISNQTLYDTIIYQALAKNDLSHALTQAKKIEDHDRKSAAFSSIAQVLATKPKEFSKFIKLIDDENEPRLKYSIIRNAVSMIAAQDPETAKTYVETIENAEEKAKVTATLIHNWAHMDPEAAIKWGMSQAKDEKSQAAMITNHFAVWARQDFEAATKWYDLQPDHLKNDNVVSQTAISLSHYGLHKKALAWTNHREDSEIAQQTKQEIYRAWENASPQEAKTWARNEGEESLLQEAD